MASVTYYTGTGQPSFTTPQPIGLPVWSKPFDDLNDRLVFSQRFMVGASFYAPAALNTTYDYPGVFTASVPTSASYYLVSEDGFSDERAGLLTWERVYATVPTTRREYTSIVYRFPAVITSISTGSYVSATFAQQIGSNRMYINTSLTASIGDQVALSYTTSGSGVPVAYAAVPVYVLDNSTNGLITEYNPDFISTTYGRGVARAFRSAGRLYPKDLPARAVIEYNYSMVTPGVTPSGTFAPRQKFTTADGLEVDYVDTGTNPTAASYQQWVAGGTFFLAEDDQWSRWLGNIYEQRTTKVVAM